MAATCEHCASALAPGQTRYCCVGCERVAGLLNSAGLGRYYTLGGRSGGPVAAPAARDHLWLDGIERALASGGHVELDVQGLRCAACSWLLEETFRRRAHARRIEVDPGLGRIALWVGPDFDLRGYVVELEAFGYVLGPADKTVDREESGLLMRAGVATALAMNVMSFSIAEYLGLTEEPLRSVLRAVSMLLTAVAVALAGPTFLRSAWGALRRGVLSLDVPIALGIVLASSACLLSYVLEGEPRYADTVSVFVALMLIGRMLERRSLGAARRKLLAASEVPALFSRRVRDGIVEVVSATELAPGDTLRLAPGELLPVEAVLTSGDAEVSLDWINGESQPRHVAAGETISPGAFLRGERSVALVVSAPLDTSSLMALVRRPPPPSVEHGAGFWDRVARAWAAGVLVSAAATFAYWASTGDLRQALLATTAVLVVTCPCGLGIANPLAHELARTSLRRAGVFVRTARALERASEIDAVVFDKTGTLTTGALTLADTHASPWLDNHASPSLDTHASPLRDDGESAIAYAMAVASTHPRAEALRRAWSGHMQARADLEVEEVVGAGLQAVVREHTYRLGAAAFAAPSVDAPEGALVFSRDGQVLITFTFEEQLRDDAAAEVAALVVDGLHGRAKPVFVLSGDTPERAIRMGALVGIDAERCVGGARPEDKAAWIDGQAPARILFVGDGLNDALAAETAYLSGTPAIDRPFLPARTDFHFTSIETERGRSGLRAIRTLLEVGQRLRRVTRRNVVFALLYNAVAIAWAASGQLHPWMAAVLMPISSLVVIGGALGAFPLSAAQTAPPALCPPPRLEPAWRS